MEIFKKKLLDMEHQSSCPFLGLVSNVISPFSMGFCLPSNNWTKDPSSYNPCATYLDKDGFKCIRIFPQFGYTFKNRNPLHRE